jgi:hypothetical protein
MNWNRDKSYCFCNKLNLKPFNIFSFNARMPCFFWRSVHMVLGFKPPRNTRNLFNDYFFRKDKTFRSILLTSAAAILRSIWITQNEVVLDISNSNLFCKFYLGEHTGFISTPNYNSVKIDKRSGWRLAILLLRPSNGLRYLELSLEFVLS